ncbi:MAG: amidohydrolase family protein, partial [Candidatus Binatia bacterium]
MIGRVWTGDPGRPHAEAVAIGGDRILAVGSEAEIARYSGRGTERLGHRRAAIVPGFIDAHLHFLALARRALEVDCSSEAARSVREILEKLGAAARAKPEGAWIRGFGYDEFFLAEKRPPQVAELDRAAPYHPVRLLHRTGHAAVLNSLAFRLLDLPVEDVVYEPADRVRGTKSEDEVELAKLARAASERLLSAGITTFHDPTPDPEGEGARVLRSLVERGTIRQRVRAYGSESGFSPHASGGGDARFRQAGVKIVVTEKSDGGEIAERVAVADRSGAQVAIHAVEEGPLVIAIEALSRLGRARVKATRHR